MREHKCYPEKANLRECMDFYFQVCFIICIVKAKHNYNLNYSVVQWNQRAIQCQ